MTHCVINSKSYLHQIYFTPPCFIVTHQNGVPLRKWKPRIHVLRVFKFKLFGQHHPTLTSGKCSCKCCAQFNACVITIVQNSSYFIGRHGILSIINTRSSKHQNGFIAVESTTHKPWIDGSNSCGNYFHFQSEWIIFLKKHVPSLYKL